MTLARVGWGLNYHWARMRVTQNDTHVEYQSHRLMSEGRCHAKAEIGGHYTQGEPFEDSRIARPGTLEHFLVERYLLYSTRFGYLYRGQVHHRPYPLRDVRLIHLEQSLLTANLLSVSDEPSHVLYSPGVNVEVFSLDRIARTAVHPRVATATP